MPLTTTTTSSINQIDDVLTLAQDLIDADQRAFMASDAGETVACRAGCTVCCHQAVPVGPAELRAIRTAIAAMPDDDQAALRARIDQATATAVAAGFTSTSLSDAKTGTREDVSRRYFELRVMCPLLVDGACSVRDARPLACREYLVSSDPAKCASLDDPTVVRIRLRRDVLDNYSKLEADHGDNGSLILALALAEEIPESASIAAQPQSTVFRQLTTVPN